MQDQRVGKDRWIPIIVAMVAGIVCASFAPTSFFDKVSQELIGFFGLVMAGVLPAMVLTASVIRAGSFSVKRIQLYGHALRRQSVFWIGLFFVSLVASSSVIIGKALNWQIILTVPTDLKYVGGAAFDFARALNFLITFAMAILLLRSIAIGNGILSLLGLATELAISDAQSRDEEQRKLVEATVAKFKDPENFGGMVELKDRPQ